MQQDLEKYVPFHEVDRSDEPPFKDGQKVRYKTGGPAFRVKKCYQAVCNKANRWIVLQEPYIRHFAYQLELAGNSQEAVKPSVPAVNEEVGMAGDYDRTNTGYIGKNKNKTSDNQPDTKGALNVEGVEYWISGWAKQGDNGPYQSIKLTRKDAAQGGAKSKPAASRPQNDDPF